MNGSFYADTFHRLDANSYIYLPIIDKKSLVSSSKDLKDIELEKEHHLQKPHVCEASNAGFFPHQLFI